MLFRLFRFSFLLFFGRTVNIPVQQQCHFSQQVHAHSWVAFLSQNVRYEAVPLRERTL